MAIRNQAMAVKFEQPLVLDQAAVNSTNKFGHPPHADNVQFDSALWLHSEKSRDDCVRLLVLLFHKVWWDGRQIKQRDEVEAARAGAEVLWKESKTTSYRSRLQFNGSCNLQIQMFSLVFQLNWEAL